MKNIFRHFLSFFIFLSLAVTAAAQTGIFDSQTDVGTCKTAGFGFYNSSNQTYTLGGAGENMWFGKDAFHYLWTTLQGDFILRAEVHFAGKGVNPHRKAGWIVRNDLSPSSPHVNATVHGSGLTSLQYRRTAGGATLETVADSFATVLQLERRGHRWIMSSARFGEPFTTVILDSLPLDHEVYVGLYVCSHEADVVETAVFRNVRIIKPVWQGFEPYHDYLGSRLEIMDVATGLRKVIFSSAHSIQAPNWTPDGRYLIFNSKGKLYRYDLQEEEVTLLPTGFATRNNNDHVLTFDGRLLGISNHDTTPGGSSAIYYLPADGSAAPVRVTRPGAGPSYLHGWAPDAKSMVFTGWRRKRFDIYSINIATGKETRLTDQPVLDDGPEYSPDGKYIYFNSARTGTMQLWRMDPDGRHQTQLTFDKWNDWFPHISPDRKRVVFISFPEEVDAQDHPFYKHCLIRMMPYPQGTPQVIGYIYGGQGTMNVPDWSPDGKKIAFVTNTARCTEQ